RRAPRSGVGKADRRETRFLVEVQRHATGTRKRCGKGRLKIRSEIIRGDRGGGEGKVGRREIAGAKISWRLIGGKRVLQILAGLLNGNYSGFVANPARSCSPAVFCCTLAFVATLILPTARAQNNASIHTSWLWHLHQPIY